MEKTHSLGIPHNLINSKWNRPDPDEYNIEQVSYKINPCEICGYGLVDSHHIIPKQFGGTDNDDNLVNLCPNHHRALHTVISYHQQFVEELHPRNSLNVFEDNTSHQLFHKIVFIYLNDIDIVKFFHKHQWHIIGAIIKSKKKWEI